MKYICSRTSVYGNDRPCDEAYEIKRLYVDRRTVDDPKKVPYFSGNPAEWYEKGTNHRVENGMICRDMGVEKAWEVEIDNLLEFIDKYGDCVLRKDEGGRYKIEIYDDYRE